MYFYIKNTLPEIKSVHILDISFIYPISIFIVGSFIYKVIINVFGLVCECVSI